MAGLPGMTGSPATLTPPASSPATLTSPASSGSGITRSELMKMVQDAKDRIAAENRSARGGSALHSATSKLPSSSVTTTPSSSHSPSLKLPTMGETAAQAQAAAKPDAPKIPAIGKTVAGGVIDAASAAGRSATTSLSSATPTGGGGGAAAAPKPGGGGMGMMPMGAMGGMGAGAGGGSGSKSSSAAYIDRLSKLKESSPYMDGTWARNIAVKNGVIGAHAAAPTRVPKSNANQGVTITLGNTGSRWG